VSAADWVGFLSHLVFFTLGIRETQQSLPGTSPDIVTEEKPTNGFAKKRNVSLHQHHAQLSESRKWKNNYYVFKSTGTENV
jgi:G:T-mismatch repair DNA endonuclease (very short patch repair protein)